VETPNSNGTYGEVDDEVDLFPDVIVARAPVENVAEAEAFVSKILAYNRTPTTDYQTNFTLAAEILWPDPYTDGSIAADMLDELYIPPQFDPITKLYQSQGNENWGTVMAALNDGQNFFQHDGHCNYYIMSVGDGALYREDMDDLVNGERVGILYSIGCWPAAIDYDCIAEHFVENPNGGGIGYIGNSRYGWGSPGNPGFGYSERYVQQFYRHLFVEGFYRPAVALAMSKSYYVSRSQVENVYRIHQYQVNLLGDPEMQMWTDIPQPMVVTHSESITSTEQVLPISVKKSDGPVENALVCIMGDELYQIGITDEAGRVLLNPAPALEESLMITVTGKNVLPYEGVITVLADGPRATIVTAEVNDTEDNGDGLINPGEEVNLTIEVRNTGTEDLTGLNALLQLQDSYCTLLDSSETFGDAAVGDTVYGLNGVRLQVGSDCPAGHLIFISIALSDSDENVWSGSLSFIVRSPTLGCYYYVLDDLQEGDGDSLMDPGETAVLKVIVGNSGLGIAHDVTAHMNSLTQSIIFPETTFSVGTMQPGSEDTLEVELSSSPQTQVPSFPAISLDLYDTGGNSITDTVIISIGTERLQDDFESGGGRWSHEGPYDEWHLSTLRSHSEDHSWYCGVESNVQYRNHMNADLIPPAVFIAPNARVSFWCWYEVTTYGVDGVYVQANDGSGWEDLDFIGSGGALDSLLNIGNLWHQESYDLSRYPIGTRVQIRLKFSSDNIDVAEGFYIDDVNSNCPIDTTTTSTGGNGDISSLPRIFSLSQNYPNPFNPTTTISFDLPGNPGEKRRVSLCIYDIRGRHVRTLLDSMIEPGTHRITWNGRNGREEVVSSGIYFYTLRCGETEHTRKMIVLK
jgi:hypothetical protein